MMKKLAAAALALALAGLPAVAQKKTAVRRAKISMERARKIAREKEHGALKSAELEREKGKLIYSFDIQTAAGLREVHVDAWTGAVVEDKAESPANEAKERARDSSRKTHSKPTKKESSRERP